MRELVRGLCFDTSPVHVLTWGTLSGLCGAVLIFLGAVPLVFVVVGREEWDRRHHPSAFKFERGVWDVGCWDMGTQGRRKGARTARRKFLLRARRGYLHSLCRFSNISTPFCMTVVRRSCGSSLCGNGSGRSEWCCIIGPAGSTTVREARLPDRAKSGWWKSLNHSITAWSSVSVNNSPTCPFIC
jgi:hypothetical protein